MPTYRENIERLKQSDRRVMNSLKQNSKDRIAFQKKQENEAIDNIGKATDLLVGQRFGSPNIASGEGGLVPFLYAERMKKKEKEGIEAANIDRARKVAEMAKRFNDAEDIDIAHHKVKYDMLVNGAYYEDADRFAQLSPHAQVAYARRKLGLYKESLPDKLNYLMAKGDQTFQIDGFSEPVSFKDAHGRHELSPLIKEALLDQAVSELRRQNGIDGFSEEMLELERINDYVNPETNQIESGAESKAKESMLGKYRKDYNITSSRNARLRYLDEFITSENPNLNGLLIKVAGTHDDNDVPLGMSGAWAEVENLLVSALQNGTISVRDLKKIWKTQKSSNPIHKDKYFDQTHNGRLQSIITRYNKKEDAFINSEKNRLSNAGEEFGIEITDAMQPGGYLDNYLKSQGRDYLTVREIDNIEAKWRQITGNGPEVPVPKFIQTLHTQASADQEAIINNARRILSGKDASGRNYLTGYDVKDARPSTMARIRQLPGYAQSNSEAIMSGDQFRQSGSHGKGWEEVIETSLKNAFDMNGLDLKPYEFDEIEQKVTSDFLAAYQHYLNTDKYSPKQAYDLARDEIQYKLGLKENEQGTRREGTEVLKYLKPRPFIGREQAGKLNEDYKLQIDSSKEFIDGIIKAKKKGQPITGIDALIPGLDKDSKEWQDLKLYVESNGLKGGIAQIYHDLARLYPKFSVEDLVNWQLSSGDPNLSLPGYSSFHEALKTRDLSEFNRRIGYKPTPKSIIQGKIEATDVVIDDDGITDDSSEPFDWEQDAINILGEPPVMPKSEDFGAGSSNRIEYMKAVTEYNKAKEEYDKNKEALIPPTISQNTRPELITREVTSDQATNLGQAVFRFPLDKVTEVYIGGEWVQMSKKDLKKLKELHKKKNFNPNEYNLKFNDDGKGFTLNKNGSYLQSFWNIPGSPVLSPNLQEYALELYTV